LLISLAAVVVTGNAFGWVEAAIVSDAVTLDLEQSGRATVSHELTMRVRGGPFKGTELNGIDFDAEPIDDATVSPVGGTAEPKPLVLTRGDDDSLRIEIGDEKGLRNGTYSFKFRYRTDLRQKARIDLRGSWGEIGWIGPRYASGLDVAKVTFRLPYAPTAPRLPEIESSGDELVQGQLPSAAMLSNLRRSGNVDELELIRPHVAKGEPVLWRIWASPNAFPFLAIPSAEVVATNARNATVGRSPFGKGLPLLLSVLLACAFSSLVWFKSRAVRAEAARQGLEPRPLVALGAKWRSVLAGLCSALALLLAVRFELPSLAAVALICAMLLSTYLRPAEARTLRGPGRWLPIHDDEAWTTARSPERGRYLDASTGRGKIVLLLFFVVVVSVVVWCFRRDPYYAMLIVMGAPSILPTLLTGTFDDLPWAREDRTCRALCAMAKTLRREPTLKVRVIGRFPEQMSVPDELRLRLTSSKPVLEGLNAIELSACDQGRALLPELSLLVRVTEDSRAHAVLSTQIVFGRGRTNVERVAVVTYPFASRPRLARLLNELFTAQDPIHVPQTQAHEPSNSARRSAARGSVTLKPGRSGSPPHATRAA